MVFWGGGTFGGGIGRCGHIFFAPPMFGDDLLGQPGRPGERSALRSSVYGLWTTQCLNCFF